MNAEQQGLAGYALILAYAIPIGLVVMIAAQALRGRNARKAVERGEEELERFAGEVASSLPTSEPGEADPANEHPQSVSEAGSIRAEH